MQQNTIEVLIFPINIFLEQCIDVTTSILNHLCYSRGIYSTSIDMILQVQDISEKFFEVGMAS